MKENKNTKNPSHTERKESPETPPEVNGFGDVTLEVMNKNEQKKFIPEASKSDSLPEENVFTSIDIEEVENEANIEKPSSEELSSPPLKEELFIDIAIEDDPSNEEKLLNPCAP
jgi:hypothetical protein